jgi:hypothetical protein
MANVQLFPPFASQASGRHFAEWAADLFQETLFVMLKMLPATALISALLLSGCAQTGLKIPVLSAPAAEEAAPVAAQTGPWRPFSADSPWNTPIAADAKIDPNSDILMGEFAALNALHINMTEWSVAVYPVDSKKAPKRYVRDLYQGQYGPGFGPRKRVPIPEGVSAAGPDFGTGYLVLEDRKAGKAWEMRQAGQDLDGTWFTGFGAEVDLKGAGVKTPWMQAKAPALAGSPRPSGAPLIAGLIRTEELKAGKIDHALALGSPNVRRDVFVAPASTALASVDGTAATTLGLPLGTRLQLDPSYDIENTALSPEGQAIARALQTYGAILVDEAGGNVLYAEAAPAQLAEWKDVLTPDELHSLFTPEFMSKNFRVLELGEPMPGKAAAAK